MNIVVTVCTTITTMPFFVLKLESNKKEVVSLEQALAQSPNGTPLCCAQPIWAPVFSSNTRIYWLDNEHATPPRITKIRALDGVRSFDELLQVTRNIDDPEWSYDNDYIENLFKDILSTS